MDQISPTGSHAQLQRLLEHHHEPATLFQETKRRDGRIPNRALLLLNSPIESVGLIEALWDTSSYKICADGGANRLFDLFSNDLALKERYLPDLVHGDLDSLREDVRAFYSDRGVPISLDDDQYSTDFGKALKIVGQQMQRSDCEDPMLPSDVIVLGSLSGRVDQGLGLLSEMIREQKSSQAKPRDAGPLNLYLVSESSLTFLLPLGENTITFPSEAVSRDGGSKALFTPNVGILPLLGPAIITTRGFEWDVNDWRTSMGGQISTSNHIVAGELKVGTDTNVIFTVELNVEYFSRGRSGRLTEK